MNYDLVLPLGASGAHAALFGMTGDNASLYSINTTTGFQTLIGTGANGISKFAFAPDGIFYGMAAYINRVADAVAMLGMNVCLPTTS